MIELSMHPSTAAIGFTAAILLAGCGGGSSDGGGSQAAWFGRPIVTELGSELHALKFADLNGDGKSDAVFALAVGGGYVMLGDGDGTFQPARPLAGVANIRDIVVGNLNGDGKADLVMTGCLPSGCPRAAYYSFRRWAMATVPSCCRSRTTRWPRQPFSRSATSTVTVSRMWH